MTLCSWWLKIPPLNVLIKLFLVNSFPVAILLLIWPIVSQLSLHQMRIQAVSSVRNLMRKKSESKINEIIQKQQRRLPIAYLICQLHIPADFWPAHLNLIPKTQHRHPFHVIKQAASLAPLIPTKRSIFYRLRPQWGQCPRTIPGTVFSKL